MVDAINHVLLGHKLVVQALLVPLQSQSLDVLKGDSNLLFHI